MKILIDINHPAHVHYFRNFIKLMEAKGHEFCVINRDSKMINQLLDYYEIEHFVRNKRPEKRGTMASLLYLLQIIIWCIRKTFLFRPDMYVGFASSACAITSFLFRRPCVLMDDTEHNMMNHRLYIPTCSVVLTPFYFNKEFNIKGKKTKQIRFNAYVEQLYLHSFYYHPNINVLKELNVKPKEFVVVRYIAYDAHHDIAVHPFSDDEKKNIVNELSKYYKVFVSLEKKETDLFDEKYMLQITPEKMHDLMANAAFLVTEGATMASEAYVLGIPYIYLNPLRCGNIDYQCKKSPERAFQSANIDEVFNAISKIKNLDSDTNAERVKLESHTINPTEYLQWVVEQYPQSIS